MLSDEKRREAAAALRAFDECDDMMRKVSEHVGRLSNADMASLVVAGACICIAMDSAGLDTETLGDYMGLLADLIDRPACRYAFDPTNRVTPYRCTACGCRRSETPGYCPQCGAEVAR